MPKFKLNAKDDKNIKNEIILANNKEKNELKNENIDEIIIQHKIEDDLKLGNIQIFGFKYIQNNKDKYKMIISSLPYISKWNTQKVTNKREIFSSCNKLASLQDISK